MSEPKRMSDEVLAMWREVAIDPTGQSDLTYMGLRLRELIAEAERARASEKKLRAAAVEKWKSPGLLFAAKAAYCGLAFDGERYEVLRRLLGGAIDEAERGGT